MASSTNKSTVFETRESHAPKLVVSLLTTLSNLFPVLGKDGENTLSDQLSGLLQDKTMSLTELSLLYCYRFGCSISDALTFVGFNGKLQDFIEQKRCFSMHRGCISLRPAIAILSDDEGVGHAPDLNAWCNMGSRIAFAFKHSIEDECCQDPPSTTVLSPGKAGEAILSMQLSGLLQNKAIPAPMTELSLLYCCKFGLSIADALKEVGFKGGLQDFIEQHHCFSMQCDHVSLCSTHAEPDATSSAELELPEKQEASADVCLAPVAVTKCDEDTEVASAADTESTTDAESCHLDSDSEVDISSAHLVMPWMVLGGRIAAALHADDDEDVADIPDPRAWRNVGCRIAAAFKHSGEDEHCQDSPDPSAWHNVGCRIAAAVKQSNEDDCCEDAADPAAWHNVGCRLIAAFKQTGEADGCHASFEDA